MQQRATELFPPSFSWKTRTYKNRQVFKSVWKLRLWRCSSLVRGYFNEKVSLKNPLEEKMKDPERRSTLLLRNWTVTRNCNTYIVPLLRWTVTKWKDAFGAQSKGVDRCLNMWWSTKKFVSPQHTISVKRVLHGKTPPQRCTLVGDMLLIILLRR